MGPIFRIETNVSWLDASNVKQQQKSGFE